MRQLDLNQLQQGLPGVTPATGSYLYEAAVVALTLQNHAPGIVLRVSVVEFSHPKSKIVKK